MKKLHVTELTDDEVSAVFRAAVKEAVEKARSDGKKVPSLSRRSSDSPGRKRQVVKKAVA